MSDATCPTGDQLERQPQDALDEREALRKRIRLAVGTLTLPVDLEETDAFK